MYQDPQHSKTVTNTPTTTPASRALDAAREYVYRYGDSYNRMEYVMAFKNRLNRSNWLTLLGEVLPDCDNLCSYYNLLRRTLKTAGPIREMMTPEENAAYDALPDKVTIYRGCGQANMIGMSWSLDKDTANSFPYTHRYKVRDPLLLTATVSKCKILAVKLESDEDEIVTFSAKPVSQEPSTAPTPEYWEARKQKRMVESAQAVAA
jgi:hypothetical protein